MKKVGGNPQILHSAESEENKKTRLSHILIFQFAIWVIAITMLESFFEKHFWRKNILKKVPMRFYTGFLRNLLSRDCRNSTKQFLLHGPRNATWDRATVDTIASTSFVFLQNANVVAVYSFLMERWQLDEINCLVVSTKNAKKCIFATPWYPKIPQKVYMKILNASPCNRENADIRFKNVKKMGFVL